MKIRSSFLWLFPLFWLVVAVEVRATDFVQARIDGITNTGDVMAYVLPATALGLTAYFLARQSRNQRRSS